jgi:hypothetical protein
MTELYRHGLRDTGAREVSPTGMVREPRRGKGRFDLIPYAPLELLAQHYEDGADKYGPNNWRRGGYLCEYLSAASRHMTQYADGDRSENHLSAVEWNLFAYQETARAIVEGRLPAIYATDPQDSRKYTEEELAAIVAELRHDPAIFRQPSSTAIPVVQDKQEVGVRQTVGDAPLAAETSPAAASTDPTGTVRPLNWDSPPSGNQT